MIPTSSYSIYPLGNNALIVDFGNRIDTGINRKVMHLFGKLQSLAIPFITDIVPAYSSLAVYYNVLALANKAGADETVFEFVAGQLHNILAQDDVLQAISSKFIRVPVCYAPKYALDIKDIADEKKCSVEDIILWHTAVKYTVFMLGFLPGFAYMGLLDERLQMRRKSAPRLAVEGGSVGIAGRQTGIYPVTSPGGWQIIGKTPLQLFNKTKSFPTLFQPGDEVQFYSITEHEFENYQGRDF